MAKGRSGRRIHHLFNFNIKPKSSLPDLLGPLTTGDASLARLRTRTRGILYRFVSHLGKGAATPDWSGSLPKDTLKTQIRNGAWTTNGSATSFIEPIAVDNDGSGGGHAGLPSHETVVYPCEFGDKTSVTDIVSELNVMKQELVSLLNDLPDLMDGTGAAGGAGGVVGAGAGAGAGGA